MRRSSTPDPPVALRDVRVFDGARLGEPQTVVIADGVFAEEAGGVAAETIDAHGGVLIPGLIDGHLHLQEPENLDTLAQWGVTTALDMACWPYERVERLRAATTGADFRTAGTPLIGPHGHHASVPTLQDAIVTTPKGARAHVAAQAEHGVDYAKAVAEAPGDGGPSPEVLAAFVTAGHEHGLLTVIHAKTVGAYELAVASGTDVVTHVPNDGVISAEGIATLAEQGRIAVPTLVTMMGEAPGGEPLISVAGLHGAGVAVLAGTDASSAPGSPVPHGSSLHGELELLVEAGMSTVEALRAATSTTAHVFGLADRGAIRPGLRADAVLLDGDPTADIGATREIRAVWCAGVSVPRPGSD